MSVLKFRKILKMRLNSLKKICDYLGESNGEKRDDLIINLAETLTNSFYVFLVRVDDLWMAYRIFETLNERGLDLTQAELIKNILIEHAVETAGVGVDEVESTWRSFVDNYESQPTKKLDMPHIIQFSYTFRNGLVKKENIFDEVSKGLRAGKIDVLGFVCAVERDSRNFCWGI